MKYDICNCGNKKCEKSKLCQKCFFDKRFGVDRIKPRCIDCNGKLNLNARAVGTLRCFECSLKYKVKENHPCWGWKQTEESKEKNRKSHLNKIGPLAGNYKDGRVSKKYYCECGATICYDTAIFGLGRCRKCSIKNTWTNDIFRDKIVKSQVKGRIISPNKPEKILIKLLGKDYKFVGNGGLIIDGFIPDFINCNGQKKIIEMYGDYWHSKSQIRDARRLKAYSKLGYKTLIVWEKELKDLDRLNIRIKDFNESV